MARPQGVIGVVRCGTGPLLRVRAHALSVQNLLRSGDKRGLHAFQGRQRHRGRFDAPEEEKGGGRGEAIARESALAKSLWGMLYADGAGVVLQSPEQLRKIMRVIAVVCEAFDLTVPEAKTEIMCVRMKRMPESAAIFSVEAAGQVDNQTNEFGYLGGNVNHDADLFIEVDRRIRNEWCSFRNYTLQLYVRLSAPLELKIRTAKSRITRDGAVRLRHVEPKRVPLRHAAQSPPQIPDSLHRLAKEPFQRPLDFLSGHAYQDGK